MPKQILLIVLLFSLLSCQDKLYVDEIDKNKFCWYFNIRVQNYFADGKTHKAISPQINKNVKDKVSSFIQRHSRRFDYIINKTFSSIPGDTKTRDSTLLNDRFCKAISTDTFYYYFTLLISGDRAKKEKALRFNTAELMKVASRFFMCDNIREKDTAISAHICVGLNGISELEATKDYTALEAFCFEAIFKSLDKKAKFFENFRHYIAKASEENKKHFSDFQSHLTAVKNQCYKSMEEDKNLYKELMSYYNKNSCNINFKIE